MTSPEAVRTPTCELPIPFSKPRMINALRLSFFLVFIGNALMLARLTLPEFGRWLYNLTELLLLGGLLWHARRAWSEIGLTRAGLGKSAFTGLVTGFVLATPPLVFFAFPILLSGPVRHQEIASLSSQEYWLRVVFEVPLFTALFEEVAFRGVLQTRWSALLGAARGMIAANIFFAAWHLVVMTDSIQQTDLDVPFLPPLAEYGLAFVVGLSAVFIGGMALSWLRHLTQNLAGSILAHWLVVAAMVTALYLRST